MGFVIYHKNKWNWGMGITIVIARGLALCTVSVTNDDYSVAYLSGVMVHTSVRKRGYGRLLLKYAERRARLLGCKKIVLSADPTQWVVDWYGRNGFVYSGKRKDGMIYMKKELS